MSLSFIRVFTPEDLGEKKRREATRQAGAFLLAFFATRSRSKRAQAAKDELVEIEDGRFHAKREARAAVATSRARFLRTPAPRKARGGLDFAALAKSSADQARAEISLARRVQRRAEPPAPRLGL